MIKMFLCLGERIPRTPLPSHYLLKWFDWAIGPQALEALRVQAIGPETIQTAEILEVLGPNTPC